MKKIASILILCIVVAIATLSTPKVYAASLNNLTTNVNKQIVRPGENLEVSINFGEALGAYTFDISYDNNIFEYISVNGGTANNISNKVRVTFYDNEGGAAPRTNMSIVFKAKEEITTSNPTEITITAEGLANSDASVTYDDITTPIVKNITVEPEYQDYNISLSYDGNIVVNKEKDMILSYNSAMGRYYEHARLVATKITTPDGGNVKLTGLNKSLNVEQDLIENGWGDPQGYSIGGKVSQTLNVQALFTQVGDYTISLRLIDRDNSDTIIAEKQIPFTVKEEAVTPPEQEPNEEIKEDETKQEEINNKKEEQKAKPTKLPKAGYNIYAVVLAVSSLIGLVFLACKKDN